MRIPVFIRAACVIVSILTLPTLASTQEPDSSQPAQDTLFSYRDIMTVGITPVPIDPINDFLVHNGVTDARFMNSGLGGIFTSEAAFGADIGSWMADANFGVMFSRADDMALKHQQFQINAGYHAFQENGFRITPYLGIGARFNTLGVGENHGSRFASFLGDSGVKSFEISNTSYHATLGADIDYIFPFMKTNVIHLDMLVGVRLGYLQGVIDNGWERDDREIAGGPDMLPSGMTAGLRVGFLMHRLIDDSATRAQRRAEIMQADEALGPRWRFGVVGGPNRSWLGENVDPMQHPFPDLWHETYDQATFGVMAGYRLFGLLTLQGNLLYTMKGGDVWDDSRVWDQWYDFSTGQFLSDSVYAATYLYSTRYIELPLVLSIGISLWDVAALRFTGGVYGGVLVDATVEYERDYSVSNLNPGRPPISSTFTPDLKPFDAGGVYGIGLDIITGGPTYSIELRGSRGFGTIHRSGTPLLNTSGSLLFGIWF